MRRPEPMLQILGHLLSSLVPGRQQEIRRKKHLIGGGEAVVTAKGSTQSGAADQKTKCCR